MDKKTSVKLVRYILTHNPKKYHRIAEFCVNCNSSGYTHCSCVCVEDSEIYGEGDLIACNCEKA